VPIKRRKSKVMSPPEGCPLTDCMGLLGVDTERDLVSAIRARTVQRIDVGYSGRIAQSFTGRLKKLEVEGILSRRVAPASPQTTAGLLSKW
jgi:hypothetical protein